jgi:hypothetical protein
VKGHQVLLTDFGISRDWSEMGHSTTSGPTTLSPRYSAPEVAAHEPRNSSADIWSMGCVFLEMWTVLCEETTSNLTQHLINSGSGSHFYYQNLDGIASWCEKIGNTFKADLIYNQPFFWIISMIKMDSRDRWNAQTLFDRIQETNKDPDVSVAFTGTCCIEEEYSAESVQSSIFEVDITEESNVSSTIAPPDFSTSGLVENLGKRSESPPDNAVSLTIELPISPGPLEPHKRPEDPSMSPNESSRSSRLEHEVAIIGEATQTVVAHTTIKDVSQETEENGRSLEIDEKNMPQEINEEDVDNETEEEPVRQPDKIDKEERGKEDEQGTIKRDTQEEADVKAMPHGLGEQAGYQEVGEAAHSFAGLGDPIVDRSGLVVGITPLSRSSVIDDDLNNLVGRAVDQKGNMVDAESFDIGRTNPLVCSEEMAQEHSVYGIATPLKVELVPEHSKSNAMSQGHQQSQDGDKDDPQRIGEKHMSIYAGEPKLPFSYTESKVPSEPSHLLLASPEKKSTSPEYHGLIVDKDGFVEKNGEFIGQVLKGDLSKLVGRTIDADGFVSDDKGIIIGLVGDIKDDASLGPKPIKRASISFTPDSNYEGSTAERAAPNYTQKGRQIEELPGANFSRPLSGQYNTSTRQVRLQSSSLGNISRARPRSMKNMSDISKKHPPVSKRAKKFADGQVEASTNVRHSDDTLEKQLRRKYSATMIRPTSQTFVTRRSLLSPSSIDIQARPSQSKSKSETNLQRVQLTSPSQPTRPEDKEDSFVRPTPNSRANTRVVNAQDNANNKSSGAAKMVVDYFRRSGRRKKSLG